MTEFGELRITIDNPKKHKYTLYNGNTPWQPVAVVGNTFVYNMQSTGTFNLLNEKRHLEFYFYNDNQQDFTLEGIWRGKYPPEDTDNVPETQLTQGVYYQRSQFAIRSGIVLWAKSKGADIESMQIELDNCKLISAEKAEEYGNDWRLMYIRTDGSTAGAPASVKIGNVLVVYIENIV